MERKFIRISELKKVLSPKEMKNVLGGSGGGSWCAWYCIIDNNYGFGNHGNGSGCDDCWSQAEATCGSSDGILIQCS